MLPTTRPGRFSLEFAVEALKLKQERFKIDHSASERTNTDSISSGFYYYPSLDDLPPRVTHPEALTVNVCTQMESMRNSYFPDEQEEQNSRRGLGSSPVRKVEIDEALINDVPSNLESRVSLHNGVLSLTIRWLKSNLDKIIDNSDSDAYPLKFVKRHICRAPPKELNRSLFPLTIDTLPLQDDPTTFSKEQYAFRTRQRAWLDALNLTTPAVDECLSELSVQQVAGAAVKKMFHLPGTTVYSDKNLPHATELMMAPCRNPPKADFATLGIISELEKHLSLVLIAGEAKRAATAKAGDNGPNYRSQLQSAIYPSLVLLLLLHQHSKSGKILPEDLFLYGVYYDEFHFEFYVHFPYWNVGRVEEDGDGDDNDDLAEGWRFAQSNLDKTIEDPDSNAYPLAFVERDTSCSVPKEFDRSLFPLTMDMIRLQGDSIALSKDLYARSMRQCAWLDVLKLTAAPVSECISELSVQHVTGAAVKKMFHLPGATVYSDISLPHATELMMAPCMNPPKTDYATLIINELQEHLSLVLMAGAQGPNYRSKLQSAIYPSLVLLLLLHSRRWKSGEMTPLPEDLFLYGVYYDESQYKLYVHFPYWNTKQAEDDDNEDLAEGWRFAQVHVGTFLVARRSDGPISALRSVRLAVALQAARAHGEQIARSFSRENYKEEWDWLLGMTWSSDPKPHNVCCPWTGADDGARPNPREDAGDEVMERLHG